MTNNSKPIKRGDTTAITRDGREVTQLTWFDCEHGSAYSVRGVLDGQIRAWTVTGRFINNCNAKDNINDIFAPVEYEWQWLYYDEFLKKYAVTDNFYKLNIKPNVVHKNTLVRIEESKREVTND